MNKQTKGTAGKAKKISVVKKSIASPKVKKTTVKTNKVKTIGKTKKTIRGKKK
ncbi:MAG: hypothetical protein Nk1A_6960 [Endomicrobiia bacterium]|nr:MAG: hypothetical protein Nk1A_6960 [Endomicrobiia bacterium]